MENYNNHHTAGFPGETYIILPTETFINYAEHEQVKRMYLTDVGYFPHARNHFRERSVGIEEYIFIYCTAGKGTISIAGSDYAIKANEAFCIPRFTAHRYYADKDDPWSILWVHIKGTDLRFFPVDSLKVIRFASDNAMNRMRFMFELLFRVLGGVYSLGNFIYISQVLQLMLAETYNREKAGSAEDQNKHVTSVIRYMQSHMETALTLDDIAAHFKMSKSYLNIIFQKYTQHSPIDFYISLKMKYACRLLKTTDKHIYEIAELVGYSDQYYFSRLFRKTVGMPPKKYRLSDASIYTETP